MYVSTWEGNGQMFAGTPIVYESGRGFGGGVNQPFVPTPGAPTRGIPGAPSIPNLRRGPINNWTDAAATVPCRPSIRPPARRNGSFG